MSEKKVLPLFSVVKSTGGWVFVKVELDEKGKVVNTFKSEPDTKAIIMERFKIEVGKYWISLDA